MKKIIILGLLFSGLSFSAENNNETKREIASLNYAEGVVLKNIKNSGDRVFQVLDKERRIVCYGHNPSGPTAIPGGSGSSLYCLKY